MRLRWLTGLLAAAAVFAAVGTCPSAETPASRSTLRIGLWTLWHDKRVTVSSADGNATVRTCAPSNRCTSAPLREQAEIRAVGDRLAFSGNSEAVLIELSGSVTLVAHGETLTLRNPVRIAAHNGELVLAVTLPVESYVERVVASESGDADSAESRKALAIVVRSFALHQAHGHADYDLCDSTHCQLLHWGRGATGDRAAAAHSATLATSGKTLWYRRQRAEAWFHQNCGGRTATPAEIWPSHGLSRKPMPWLASRIDSYCSSGGAKEWSADLSLAELTAALKTQGLAAPGWETLTVSRRGESGRAVMLRVEEHEISAEDFRLAIGRTLGWNRILSTWFEVTRIGDHFNFHGRGSGHGVGLCQAGAAAMAAGGHDQSQILAQYFPGATAADEATGLPWQTLRGEGFVLESLDPADEAHLADLNRALAGAESRSGLRPAAGFTVRAFRSTQAFRESTLAPGWVAAFTEGAWIGTQPLKTLKARGLLEPTLRHEFLHALVEGQAAAGTPLWLREGLVEAWVENDPRAEGAPPALKPEEVNRALSHAASEVQSEAAHRAARWYAAKLLGRFGRAQVVEWLHSGLPTDARAEMR